MDNSVLDICGVGTPARPRRPGKAVLPLAAAPDRARFVGTLCVVMVSSSFVFAQQNPTESQAFDTQDSSRAAGWRESGRNRDAALGLDFGFSDSNQAGGQAGEAGGIFPGNTGNVVEYYADLSIGEWTLDDPLMASGKFFWDDVNGPGTGAHQLIIGFFDATDQPSPPDHLGAEILDANSQFSVLGLSDGTFLTKHGFGRTAPEDTPMEFLFEYDPTGGAFGEGLVEATFGDFPTSRYVFRALDREIGAQFNAFGIFNSPRIGGGEISPFADAYIDEVTYTSNGEPGPALVEDTPLIQAGDSNLDRQFNTADIVQVLSANKFEQDVDATWAEGDWNGAPDDAFRYGGDPPPGDGRFTTLDIVAALAGNTFETGEITALREHGTGDGQVIADVPEPSSIVLLVFGTLGCLRRFRRCSVKGRMK